jgi:hypothetical protein
LYQFCIIHILLIRLQPYKKVAVCSYYFLAGSRAFRFSRLSGYSSASGFQRASFGRRFRPGVTATCNAGLPLQSLPE